MHCTRLLVRNVSPTVKPRRKPSPSPICTAQITTTTTTNPLSTANPTTDSDQLAYRLCELSLQKIQKEARALEPDLRHVLACTSMQRLAQQDLSHRLDALQSAMPVQTLPLLPGCDEPYMSDEDAWDMRSLEEAVSELEWASKKGEIARYICFQQIREM
ncbi:uncharacterized protein N7469_003963 [Penicillium citrinum]|uniref:Uncharacterized protein n=2 Tax=Penicillium TaxID=5073 RepID=A0A9W9P464_PENCI|nr:uncharacterized protein N7469_003963 [Penicillium citrinum]KAJ5234795.1 hypothetical protein N7469_003963 [Penicillium citrinum]KAJ5590414.1 hypothetical protein N7450_004386 [Penicillium hetheringtonii]KAK5800731.1 hypothetical protein VI817_002943 [Penicillium citrinum]